MIEIYDHKSGALEKSQAPAQKTAILAQHFTKNCESNLISSNNSNKKTFTFQTLSVKSGKQPHL